jgi:hypothetical protein
MLRLVRAVFSIQSEKRTIGDDQQNGEQYMNFWIVVMATLLMNAFRVKAFSQSRPIVNLMRNNVQLRKVVGLSTLRKGGYTVIDEVRLTLINETSSFFDSTDCTCPHSLSLSLSLTHTHTHTSPNSLI